MLTPFESQLETSINSCMPDDHVPEAERNNRVIQERVRIKYHRYRSIYVLNDLLQRHIDRATVVHSQFKSREGPAKAFS